MNKEDYFINLFNNKTIGDDAAIKSGYSYSMDAFCEDVHFKREWMSLKQIAYKSMIVNISDAIAMNAIPKYALLSVAIPKNFSYKDLEQLQLGFEQAAKDYKIEIIGGDTIANIKLDISITIVAKTNKPLFRKGLRVGDVLAYTGDIGSVKKDLNILFRQGKISSKSKFINPILRQKFINKARRWLNVGMDISDGLFHDLDKLQSSNKKLGLKVVNKYKKNIACSGEEYEMLVGFSKKNIKRIKNIAKECRINLNIIGKSLSRGKFKNRCKKNHF